MARLPRGRSALAVAIITNGVIGAACTTSAPSATDVSSGPRAATTSVPLVPTPETTPQQPPEPDVAPYVPLDDHPRRFVIDQVAYPSPGPRLDGETPGAPVHLEDGVPPAANQFWTSLIAADGPSRVWLTPLAVEFATEGLTVAQNDPEPDDAGLVTRWSGQLRIVGDVTDYEVTGYGDFSVSVDVSVAQEDGTDARFSTTLAQGHPALPLRNYDGPLALRVLSEATVIADGVERPPGDEFSARSILIDLDADRWMVAADEIVQWDWSGSELSATLDGATVLLAPEPDDATPSWPDAIELLATAPVTTTAASAALATGTVRQVLTWDGPAAIDRPVLLLPHHQTGAVGLPLLGSFETVYGTALVVAARDVEWTAPLPGLLGAWPALDIDPVALNQAIAADDNLDNLRPTSYFGATDLRRLTTAIDVLTAAGVPAAEPTPPTSSTPSTPPPFTVATGPATTPPGGASIGSLDVDLPALIELAIATTRDRLIWSGDGDESWITVDSDWSIPFAAQTEFKSELFNDRHFHQGYLLQSAASVAPHDPNLIDELGPAVDVLAASLLGPAMPDPGHWNSPTSRPFVGGGLFNPYLGHSLADGLSLSNRGNNQESSSEAVGAWAGVARWGALTGRAGLERAGLIRYAIESRTANAYWLRDGTVAQPSYEPTSAGIVWGDRIEYRTFFSGADEAIVGIQLIPFDPSALLRVVPEHRDDTWSDVSSRDRMWSDLFVMERAQTDPTAVDAITAWLRDDDPPSEGQHGHAWVTRLGWTTMLAELGAVNDLTAVPPIGRAFDGPDGVTLVAANLGVDDVTVEFSNGDSVVGVLAVPAGETVTKLVTS